MQQDYERLADARIRAAEARIDLLKAKADEKKAAAFIELQDRVEEAKRLYQQLRNSTTEQYQEIRTRLDAMLTAMERELK